MEYIGSNLNIFVIVIGALIGSIKANLESNSAKPLHSKLVDVCLGLFCGIALGSHYENALNLSGWIAGLLALTSATVGANILEVLKELTPSITKKIVTQYFKK